MDICKQSAPTLLSGDGRKVECHLYDEKRAGLQPA
jgi:hypothetical protein